MFLHAARLRQGIQAFIDEFTPYRLPQALGTLGKPERFEGRVRVCTETCHTDAH